MTGCRIDFLPGLVYAQNADFLNHVCQRQTLTMAKTLSWLVSHNPVAVLSLDEAVFRPAASCTITAT